MTRQSGSESNPRSDARHTLRPEPDADACDECMRRTWLVGRLGGHLERERRRILELLALGDGELLAAVAGGDRVELTEELGCFGAATARAARSRAVAAGLTLVCRCSERFPSQLRDAPAPPAVLHIFGEAEWFLGVEPGELVSVVGARRATEYGREVAFALSRGAGGSGLTVVSGMALGIDARAHEGAMAAPSARTVAVLAGSAHLAQPASRRRLHAHIAGRGAVISELGPGAVTRRWAFPARNRLIAALAAATVVVEGRVASGSLLTARAAAALDRPVGAVPGNITNELAAGPNALLAAGAHVIRHPQDLLDMLFGAGVRSVPDEDRPPLSQRQARLLAAVGAGQDTAVLLMRGETSATLGMSGGEVLAALAELELAGRLRRGSGGRLVVVP